MASRLVRHEKQAVRRWLRARGRAVGRGRSDDGTAIGMRALIQRANRTMRTGRIAYPQEQGCGMIDVEQVIRE